MSRFLTLSLRSQIVACLILACSIALPARLAAQDAGNRIVVTVTRTIHPSLPPLRLRITSTEDSASVDRIEIFNGDALVQTIDDPGMEDIFLGQEINQELLDWMVQTSDLTFDGYADLWLMQWRGAHEVGYGYWLYNANSGTFAYYKPLSGECGYPDIDSVAKTMSLRCNNGAAGAYYAENTYRYDNSRFILVRQETQDEYGRKMDRVERITRELRNGKLRVVKRKVIRIEDLDKE